MIFYVKPKYEQNKMWIFYSFETNVWCIFFLLLFLLSLVSYSKEKILQTFLSKTKKSKISVIFQDYIVNAVGLVANQGKYYLFFYTKFSYENK